MDIGSSRLPVSHAATIAHTYHAIHSMCAAYGPLDLIEGKSITLWYCLWALGLRVPLSYPLCHTHSCSLYGWLKQKT
jgi:hypothetical protein